MSAVALVNRTVGLMYVGDGIPTGYYLSANGRNYGYFVGALDIVAHELTKGVTSSASQLIYRGESGALNEAFSDVMGASVEFYIRLQALDWGKPTTPWAKTFHALSSQARSTGTARWRIPALTETPTTIPGGISVPAITGASTPTR
jgi:hypothetical protein